MNSQSNVITHIAPEGHPIHTLMEEHATLLDFTAKLIDMTDKLKEMDSYESAGEVLSAITGIVDHLKASQSHYLREENVLFSYLEKHGIDGPPRAMWAEHDQIREVDKNLYNLMDNREETAITEFSTKLGSLARTLSELLSSHYYKENNVLFPMAMQALTDDEWQETTRQFAEIGYCCFSPKSALDTAAGGGSERVDDKDDEGLIDLGSGKLSINELKAMLNRLPVEITFVDKDDTFRYFNQVNDAIFIRPTAAIGLKVQQCHPEKSVHIVNKILEDFKSGAKDEVAFWINLQGKYVYIRYFAVRDSEGKYIGCMEVTMDIKDIQKITGEKRLAES
ncbi:DUF438 domain-containing protein [bacterium]|nr:DUF438 domain-containing protein [bacterium]